MNFMEAVKAMKEGEKVRRECCKTYCYADKGILKWGDGATFQPHTAEFFEATDWEIYEETLEEHEKHCDFCKEYNHKDNWNLADKKCSGGFPSCEFNAKDIKTFIQKVKEDVDKRQDKGDISLSELKEIIDKRVGDL